MGTLFLSHAHQRQAGGAREGVTIQQTCHPVAAVQIMRTGHECYLQLLSWPDNAMCLGGRGLCWPPPQRSSRGSPCSLSAEHLSPCWECWQVCQQRLGPRRAQRAVRAGNATAVPGSCTPPFGQQSCVELLSKMTSTTRQTCVMWALALQPLGALQGGVQVGLPAQHSFRKY